MSSLQAPALSGPVPLHRHRFLDPLWAQLIAGQVARFDDGQKLLRGQAVVLSPDADCLQNGFDGRERNSASFSFQRESPMQAKEEWIKEIEVVDEDGNPHRIDVFQTFTLHARTSDKRSS